jgi:nucleoid DNA-binding protein
MIPKKASKLYKEVSEEFDASEDLIETLLESYYKEVRKKLSNLSDLRINVDGLGHFVIKVKKVKKAIPHYEKVLVDHDTSTFGAYHNKKSVEEKLELLKLIDEKIEKELTKKKSFKDEKYSQTNLAEPETDN